MPAVRPVRGNGKPLGMPLQRTECGVVPSRVMIHIRNLPRRSAARFASARRSLGVTAMTCRTVRPPTVMSMTKWRLPDTSRQNPQADAARALICRRMAVFIGDCPSP